MIINHLKWDSDFFGIKIGKIDIYDENDFDSKLFKSIANEERYELIYVIKYFSIFSKKKSLNGEIELFDIMLTMSMKFNKNKYLNIPFNLLSKLSSSELKGCYHIAELTSGVSRFNNEPKIGNLKTKALYRKWIDNTINQEFSDGIFIEKKENKIGGLHIIRTDRANSIGYFTLTGVDSNLKREGIGKKLWMQSFAYWAHESNILIIKSPFSFQNLPSFNFHLKMGFDKVEEVKYIYHFRNNF